MQCTLLVPQLFWPREAADVLLKDLELPALEKVLARARGERAESDTAEAWLCKAFEVERQQDWPVAPLTLALDGGEPAGRYWLRADPVHMKVERDRLLLVESALFDVTLDEAQAFAQTLSSHFADEEIVFRALAPKRWYVSAPVRPELVTCHPGEAAGRDVQRFLPSGADALKWHRVFNEAQMLLHEHPLNAAREARGEPVVNSVWFWGGGMAPRVPGRHFSAVWSDEPLALALAVAADVPAQGLPADARAWLAAAGDTQADLSQLVVLTALVNATRYGDAEAWRSRAAALESDWLAPLVEALRRGRIARLVLATPGAAGSWRFELARGDLLKFWRAPRPLARYA